MLNIYPDNVRVHIFLDDTIEEKDFFFKWTLTLFHVGGGETSPPQQFFLIPFFCKNRIDLKILDFLSYTYTHPIQLKNFKILIVSM